jgi:hypothetical protein
VLQPSDLDTYVTLYQLAVQMGPLDSAQPKVFLPEQADGLYPMEMQRLQWSLHILAILDDLPMELVVSAVRICQDHRQAGRCTGLDNAEAWIRAIRCSFRHDDTLDAGQLTALSRQTQVAHACRRLRAQGYKVEINAYGPNVPAAVQRQISKQLNNLISQLGENAVFTLLAWMVQQRLVYDGMWLFGTSIPGFGQVKRPSLPVGWLLSIAMRHLGKKCKARSKQKMWDCVTQLAIDMGAAIDCERYSQFEQLNISPTEFWRSLVDSLHWREMFTLQQAPGLVLPRLLKAFRSLEWPAGSSGVAAKIIELTVQCAALVDALADEKLSQFTMHDILSRFPLVGRFGMVKAKQLNRGYDEPLAMAHRNHDRYMLFEVHGGQIYALPRSMTAAAACHVIVTQIWKELGEVAGSVVGDAVEKVVELACLGKAEPVVPKKKYRVGKTELEIDVATVEDDRVVIFEAKAKSLTAEARSGDTQSYISDYTNSYLRILDQLTIHEENLRAGKVTLVDGRAHDPTRGIIKVAVSPLSFGPVSDPELANALLRSIANASLGPMNLETPAAEIWTKFNTRKDKIMARILRLAPPNGDGEADVVRYLRTVRWLDVGQLLYLMDRSSSVSEAMRPLGTTFSSQDFWTEVACADRLGIGLQLRPLGTSR